jgi:phage/plasmid-like protein (TIGR03299 family)
MLRTSDGAQLGVVGTDFTPVQNAEAFDWIRPMIDSGEATIEAAGSLRGGRRVWILAAVRNATVDVLPNDPVRSYVLFAHGHDGSLAVRAGFTTTRVVCQNTLSAAVNDGKQLLKFKHTANVLDQLNRARDAFDMQRARLRTDAEVFRMLANKRLSDANLVRYVRETLHEGAGNDNAIKVRNVDTIVRLAHEGRGATPGTLWGGFNALTEFATHERGRSADARVNANWFGSGGDLIQRALETAVRYAEKLPLAA